MTASEKLFRYSKQLCMLSILRERNLITEEEHAIVLQRLNNDYAACVPGLKKWEK